MRLEMLLLIVIRVVATGDCSKDTNSSSLVKAAAEDHLPATSWSHGWLSVVWVVSLAVVVHWVYWIINNLKVVFICLWYFLEFFDVHQLNLIAHFSFKTWFKVDGILIVGKIHRDNIIFLHLVDIKSFIIERFDQIHNLINLIEIFNTVNNQLSVLKCHYFLRILIWIWVLICSLSFQWF